jgi:hypothetical protein
VPEPPDKRVPAPIDPRRLFVVSCLAMFVFGMVIAMLGTLFGLPEMRQRLAIDLAQQGAIFSCCSSACWPRPWSPARSIDRFGSKVVLVGGAGAVTIAVAMFAAAGAFVPAAGRRGAAGAWRRLAEHRRQRARLDVYPETAAGCSTSRTCSSGSARSSCR